MKLYTRLFLYFSVIFCLLMGVIMLFQYSRERDFRIKFLDSELMTYNEMIYNYIHTDSPNPSDLKEFVALFPDSMLRITIIDTTGLVRYDSSFDGDSTLENHLYRPEILQLSEQSVGKDIRLSQSLGEEYYYLSQQFPGVYIRSSLPYNMSVTASLKANLFFIYIMAALLLVVMLVLYIISKRFSINLKESEDKLKRELTQNISHELKTPVSSILGYMESVLDNPDLPAERLHFFVERTHHQAQRLRALLQDISTLNKLDESRNLYERSECDVVRIVNEVLSDFHVEIEQKGVTIDNRLTGALELRGNRTLLYSIFHNLIDNALNYAGEGITIEIDLISKVGGYYALSVSDNGVGIDQEHVSRIFERFYRVDKGRSRKLGGTGLGLSIVKNGVLFHHGTIKAQSQLGEGVEFIFTLRKF